MRFMTYLCQITLKTVQKWQGGKIKMGFRNELIKTLRKYPKEEITALIKHPRLLHKINKTIKECSKCKETYFHNAMEGTAFTNLCSDCKAKIKPYLNQIAGDDLHE